MVSSSDNVRSSLERKLLRGWIVVCVAVGAALALSQLAEIPARSALRGYDNTFNYLWLRSAMVDGDWDFRNDLAVCDTLVPGYRASALALPRTPTGRIPDKYGVGWSVLTLPFYLVADALVALGRWLGIWSLARDGFNPVYQICIQLGHAGLAVLALLLATRTIARWLGDGATVGAAVVAVWAASPLLYYQTVDVSMSHGAAFFAVTLCAYALVRAGEDVGGALAAPRESAERSVGRPARNPRDGAPPASAVHRDWPWWWLAGAGWGLAVTTRFQLGVFGLLAAWSWVGQVRAKKDVVAPVGFFVAGAAPFVLLQLWAWHVVYGRWLVFGYGAEGESFHWAAPELFNSLFSPWHGLFYWHPFLLVASVGFGWWALVRPGLPTILLVVLAANFYVNAAWWCWWFASSFGNRSYDAALLPLMAGAAWLGQRTRGRWRAMLLGLALAAGLWNFYAVLLYRVGAISRSEPVTWGQMIRAAGKVPVALRF